MTDDELRDLVASLAVSQKETDKQQKETGVFIKELRVSQQETSKQQKETGVLIKELRVSQQETSKQQKETSKQQKETSKQQKETGIHIAELRASQEEDRKQQRELDKRQKKTDQQLKELGKQIGGLGKKFGSFTEGLALPSMQKILQEKFNMEIISPSVRIHKAGADIEIDVLAYANSSINEVYVVEVKSHLREEGIAQLQNIMNNFRKFFPEHKDKKVFGILAAVDMSVELKARVRSLGFYTAHIREDIFSLDVPENFIAKAY